MDLKVSTKIRHARKHARTMYCTNMLQETLLALVKKILPGLATTLICSPIPTCTEDLDASADSRNVSKVSGECSGGMLSSGLQGVLRGTECTQKCASEHYEYTSGDATRTCQENGTWSKRPLMCSAVPAARKISPPRMYLLHMASALDLLLPSGLQGVLAGTVHVTLC